MKMTNQKFADIALEVGGSHYPDVGGQLLEKFGEAVVEQCAVLVERAVDYQLPPDILGTIIRNHFGLK